MMVWSRGAHCAPTARDAAHHRRAAKGGPYKMTVGGERAAGDSGPYAKFPGSAVGAAPCGRPRPAMGHGASRRRPLRSIGHSVGADLRVGPPVTHPITP